jgi:Leucine-rich repeat (LRR) protein
VRNFPSLRSLSIRATNLRRIPSNAFSSPSSDQSKLTILRFGGNAIQEVGEKAFFTLSNVTWLDIADNQLKTVKGPILAFREPSEKPLQIDLDFNQLDSESFDQTSFSQINRPAILFIRRNNITYLKEDVFSPLIKSTMVRIFPSGNPIECYDCRNYWIIQLKGTQGKDNLNEISCKESRNSGQTIWDISEKQLKYCSLKRDQLMKGIKGLTTFLRSMEIIDEPHSRHINRLLDEL